VTNRDRQNNAEQSKAASIPTMWYNIIEWINHLNIKQTNMDSILTLVELGMYMQKFLGYDQESKNRNIRSHLVYTNHCCLC